MSISRYAQTAILPTTWELRANFSAYDAAYIALAETLEAPSSPGMQASLLPSRSGPR